MPEQSQQHSHEDNNATNGRGTYWNGESIDPGYGQPR
jgi:hypothetical protein